MAAVVEQLNESPNLATTTGSYPTNPKLAAWIYDRIVEYIVNELGDQYWDDHNMKLVVSVDDGFTSAKTWPVSVFPQPRQSLLDHIGQAEPFSTLPMPVLRRRI